MKLSRSSVTFSIMFAALVLQLNSNSFASNQFETGKVKCNRYVIGNVAEYMPKNGNNIGTGSLIADAMLSQTKSTGVQVALISALEVRSDLLPGAVTKYDVKRLVLNSHLITFELSASDLNTLIEKIASKKHGKNGDDAKIHVSGVRFSLDKSAKSGERIKGLEIGSLDDGYRMLESSEVVRIVTTIYSINELIAVKGKRFIWNISFEYTTLHNALEQYIYSLRAPISNCPENRINDVNLSILVFSDPHYFEPSLLVKDGPAFQTYLAKDRKLIAESHEILMSTVSKVRNAHPDICLIPGDLTKDGELLSHTRFNQIITDSLLSVGIKVYIAPGNHDINNNEAFSYNGNIVLPVESISSESFTDLYENSGYGEAIARDTASLTYIAEPENGLWIMSIDDCKYRENTSHSKTGGSLSESTLSWIIDKLDYARKHNITVLGMMHHAVTEHYTGQTQIMMGMFKDYVIDNWISVRDSLAAHGLSTIFTGHYHANDIVKHTDKNGNFIFDIETGSTVTWPCPIRTVNLLPSRILDITSSYIDQINYPLPVNSFQEYAKTYLYQGLYGMVYYLLTSQFTVPDQQAKMLAPLAASAFCAHYAGDEQPGQVDIATYTQLKMSSDPLIASMGLALESLWTDLLPGDNSCKIDLNSGSIK